MTTPAPETVTIDGEEFYQWKTVLRVPKNWTPESGVFIAVAPPGGIANFPAAVQGAPGLPITIRNSNIVPLASSDPTPASFTWTLITPGTATTQPVYDVTLTIHEGAPGASGAFAMLDATDLTGAHTAGYVFRINPSGTGVELVTASVGNTYWPATITVLSNASGGNALCSIVIPSAPFPRSLHCNGQIHIHPDGADVQVDLVARLGATDGLVIARGFGVANGADQILVLSASPPAGSTAGFGQLAAGVGGTVLIRAEVQAGTSTFDTISGRALFSVDAVPIG